MPTSLNLLVLRSENPKALAEVWAHFGFSFSPESHGAGPIHYVAKMEDFVLEIYPRDSSQATTIGTRIGLRIENVEALLAGLPEGLTLLKQYQTTNEKRAVVSDFEGHKIELTSGNG